MTRFDVRDVVRHPLVARIVDAYDQREKAQREAADTPARRTRPRYDVLPGTQQDAHGPGQ